MRVAIVVLVVLVTTSCSGEGSLGGPSATPRIPDVAGHYAGIVTGVDSGGSETCPASTTVSQSGANLSIAPIQLGGSCGFSVPVGPITIDTTGAFLNYPPVAVQTSCGTYQITRTGGFFGRDLRIAIHGSGACGPLNLTVNLTRS